MQEELESIGNELPGQRTLWVRKYPVCQLNNCIVVDIYTLIHGVTLHLLYVDIRYMFHVSYIGYIIFCWTFIHIVVGYIGSAIVH